MNVLFVCTEGMNRSPTAAYVFSKLAKKKRKKVSVKFAGVDNHSKYALTKKLLKWADRIYAMEDFHKNWIVSMDKSTEKKITILDIEDVYMKKEPGLIEILEEKLEKEL